MIQLIIPPIIIVFALAILIVFLAKNIAKTPSSAMPHTPEKTRKNAGNLLHRLRDYRSQKTPHTRTFASRFGRGDGVAQNSTQNNDQVVSLRKANVITEKKDDGTHREPEEHALMERIEENPHDSANYEKLGDYYMEQEQFEDARECYKYVLRLDPRHKRAQVAMRNLDRVL
ncbi:MAG: hypothetical protein CR954_00545 [Candidatus Moraniibacteriota bacterium]|nr:MAG: hypothetical protein CR954_00545 [Candidatus Moranbacteria bacterium]